MVDVDSNYNIHLESRNFPISYHFKFIFSIPELNVLDEQFTEFKDIDWQKNFTKTGSYQFNIQVYLYPFNNYIYGWKIAETAVTLEIKGEL